VFAVNEALRRFKWEWRSEEVSGSSDSLHEDAALLSWVSRGQNTEAGACHYAIGGGDVMGFSARICSARRLRR
jgi:hypothetical protein